MKIQYEQSRKALAQQLGVKDIDAYFYPGSFPVGYFAVELHNGMPITLVHQVVRGYTQAYKCPNNHEVYDFYSTERPLRTRIQIAYDEQFRYLQGKSLKVDDPNSDPVNMANCVIGRIGK
jgi:hypothetical protein